MADDGGVAAHRQVAAESQRKRADGAGICRRGWIVRQNHIGDLFGGDGGAGKFDFVFYGRGGGKKVAQAVWGGGVGGRRGEDRRGKKQPRARRVAGPFGAAEDAPRGCSQW